MSNLFYVYIEICCTGYLNVVYQRELYQSLFPLLYSIRLVKVMWNDRRVLVYGVRSLLLAVCLGSTLSVTVSVTTLSLISFFLFIGSCVVLPAYSIHPTAIIHVAEKKLKTKDIISQLYPPLSDPELEIKVNQAVTKFVSYDPETVPSLERFAMIKNNSDCHFAKKAKLWGNPCWKESLSIEENIYRLIPMFIKFTVVLPTYKLDGFVIELPGDSYGSSIETLGDGMRQVLQTLSDNDPAGLRCMDKSYIDKRGWVFEFNKVTFFITTFAPFYPENHPRFAHGARNSYILFQPELSFAFHDLPPDTPETNWENPKTVRDRIRIAFKDAGREYAIPDSIYHPMVEEMIRPIKDTDSLYQWWKKS